MSTVKPSARSRSGPAALAWSVVAAVLAIVLAPLGVAALYAVAGILAVLVAGYLLRQDLRRPGAELAQRVGALWRPSPSVRAGAGGSRLSSPLVVVAGGVMSAGIAWLVASQGTKAVAALLGVLLLAGLGVVLWPLLADLLFHGESGRRPSASRQTSAAGSVAASRVGPFASFVATLLIAGAGAGAAWLLASLGIKALAAAIGVLVVGGLFLVAKDRSVVFTFVAVCSLTLVLHKSLGPQDLTQSGGAISIYVTTFDVMVLLLYGLWALEGTLVSDIREGFRHPLIWLPLVGAALLLPSLVAAPSIGHAAAELTRMAWMFLLYVYIALRVRTRKHVWAVLGGLVVFMTVELTVVVLQWRTGGVLGLSFLGVPQTLTERTTDSQAIGRPFGTIIHPVFMAAAVGSVATLALAFAIELRRSLIRVTAAAVSAAGLACIWISQARASAVTFLMVAAVLVVYGIRRQKISWRVVGLTGLAGLAGVVVMLPRIMEKLSDNFGTGHFWTEVDSRLQMNDIAIRMIEDHPLLGVGLNNHEVVLPAYEAQPVIFFGHPVHNLYLLFFSETGLIGLLGVVLVGIVNANAAIRLGRTSDPLFRPLGIGVAGAMAFLMVEELLGFSLRQDIPLALYWLLAGLVVAGIRMTGTRWPAPPKGQHVRRPTPSRLRERSLGRPSSMRVVSVAAVAGLAVASAPSAETPQPAMAQATVAATTSRAAVVTNPRRLVFTALERSTGVQGIFTASTDGTGIRRITPADGRFYSWPRWAFGNTKIVFTVRSGPPGSPEAVVLMNPDGSGVKVLQRFEYRIGQPVVEPNGRFLLFTAQAPWFPEVATFRMDLSTGESTNLTAVSEPKGGFDSDPFLDRGDEITFVWTEGPRRSSIAQMRTDGTQRRRITHDSWYNTDPALSADRSTVVMASYRGPGAPSGGDSGEFSTVKSHDWHIVVRPVRGGSERVLTRGENCAARPAANPCDVTEMSGVLPRFTPDGRSVSFAGALDSTRTCICRIGLDGSRGEPVLASSQLAIDWYDWPQRGGLPTSTERVGTRERSSRLLVVTARPDGTKQLMAASPDLMHRIDIPLPRHLEPLDARWGPDRRTIVFTARVPVGAPKAPHPAPPPGRVRRVHATFDDIDPVATNLRRSRLAQQSSTMAEQQVFLRLPSGKVRKLTDPWIEDWADGLAPGDARSNTDPVLSASGRFVTVTNTSSLTGESFLLRIDLRSGTVTNLTNATAGVVATDDSQPAVSPDGSRVAFTWTEGGLRGVHVMDAVTGDEVHSLVTGSAPASMATWGPDGRSLAWVSDRGSTSRVVAARVTEHGTGASRVLSSGLSDSWRPVVSPEGDRVVFLSASGNVLGLHVASLTDGGPSRPVQPDPLHNFFAVDWR